MDAKDRLINELQTKVAQLEEQVSELTVKLWKHAVNGENISPEYVVGVAASRIAQVSDAMRHVGDKLAHSLYATLSDRLNIHLGQMLQTRTAYLVSDDSWCDVVYSTETRTCMVQMGFKALRFECEMPPQATEVFRGIIERTQREARRAAYEKAAATSWKTAPGLLDDYTYGRPQHYTYGRPQHAPKGKFKP